MKNLENFYPPELFVPVDKVVDMVCLIAYRKVLEAAGYTENTSLEKLVSDGVLDPNQPAESFRYVFTEKYQELQGRIIEELFQAFRDVQNPEKTF